MTIPLKYRNLWEFRILITYLPTALVVALVFGGRRQFGAPSMGLANMSSTQSCGSSSISKPAVSDRNQTKHVYVLEFVLGTLVHYKHMQHVGPKATRPKNLGKDATISLITTT